MGGNYSRAETICGNTVIVTMGCETFFQMLKGTSVKSFQGMSGRIICQSVLSLFLEIIKCIKLKLKELFSLPLYLKTYFSTMTYCHLPP